MKWVLLVAAGLIALITVVTVVGYLLPKQHRASVHLRLKEPAENVWQVITNFSSWPSWNQSIKSMTRQDDIDGHPVWLMVDRNGKLPNEVLESSPPEAGQPGRLVTRIADSSLPFGGRWTWEVVADGEECVVSITEDGEIRNPIFRFMARFVFGYTGTAETFLKALANKFGEAAEPVSEIG